MPYDANQNESEILKFWKEKKIFEKSVNNRPESKPYIFYDGPPFATGLPHYGHIVASLMKDVVPRFWTMRGCRVERKWGWDCHGLPVENIIEEKLKLKSKKDIEEMGIEKFNEECRKTVLTYVEDWKKTISRVGRWVDMENAYKTMDLNYMETVWWVFKQLWDKGLIYQGHKAMHICPRCVTPLSNFEVTQNYKEVEDLSVVVMFKVQSSKFKSNSRFQPAPLRGARPGIPDSKSIYLLAWTTTPWTLPGNVVLAVGESIKYLVLSIEGDGDFYIVAKDRLEKILKDKKYEIVKEIKGSDLVGLEYEPLFPYFADTPNAFRVVAADFVSTTEGTGIVHIAPAFGENDYNLGQQEKIPLVQHVAMDGRFISEVKDFAGWEAKPKEAPTKTDAAIIAFLEKQGKIFAKEKVAHSYPHCWRCDTPLLNYATSSWFVKVAEMKNQLIKNNKKINWVPKHMKEGRFGEWLAGARDWAISRNRYWGTPLPVWICDDVRTTKDTKIRTCDNTVVVGSVKELEKLSGQKPADLHKHIVDKITFKCKKCGGEMRRIPEVLDCWFESGSMPYAQFHYPFENKKKFEDGFPCEFIAEGQDQTRGWFYTLHVLANALFGKPAFKNVIVNGIVLAEDGKKMSKRLKNYPEPDLIMDKYGADALRYYLLTSPVVEAEGLNFSEAGVRETYNKLINTLWNVVEFYKLYVDCHSRESGNPVKTNFLDPRFRGDDRGRGVSRNILDKWIVSKLHLLIKNVTKGMEEYKLVEASRPILDFTADLSQWWLRRSRSRFKSDNPEEKNQAIDTLYLTLNTLSKILAPFTPFVAEKIYLETCNIKHVTKGCKESVHLEDWPAYNEKLIDKKVLEQMDLARKIVEMGLAIRAEQGIKVRQVLSELGIKNYKLGKDFGGLIKEELNIKDIKDIMDIKNWAVKEDAGLKVGLNIEITPELKKEGLAREIIRAINQMRKDKGLTIKDKVAVKYQTKDKLLKEVFVEFGEEIKKSVLAKTLSKVKEGEEGEEVKELNLRLKIEKL